MPWHRVVNARGEISTRALDTGAESEQRRRLDAEGIEFDEDGRIDLTISLWMAGSG